MRILVLVNLVSLLIYSLAGFCPAASAQNSQPSSTGQIKTVWVIVMENQNWSSIKNSKFAPYINQTLIPQASHAEQYFNPPNIHPSLPNYLWMEAGTNFGILDDNSPLGDSQSSTQHLVTLLKNSAHGAVSWRAYEENISGKDCPISNRYPYAVRHDPFVYFDDVTDRRKANSVYCIEHIRPFEELAKDLDSNSVARYNFITPNVCNDMHDSCSPLRNQIAQGDAWLAHHLPMILNSQAYRDGGVVFLTWDEADTGDGPIGMIVLSPLAKGKSYSNSIHYNHGALLRSLQEIFGVTPYLGNAATQPDLRDLFSVFP
ncbi:MAG TPA: alkaline phosphatase family protein [Terriglobales bacterium]|nr:alkaline phosphatase family protein [Terriglobales bacterium]